MSLDAGSYTLGPQNATLHVKTGKTGAASKAGHNLLIEVTDWEATLTMAGADVAAASVVLHADGSSLFVREGSGGMTSLGDDDKASIKTSIDEEVLKGQQITFRSTAITGGIDVLNVAGDLELGGKTRPVSFALTIGGGAIDGTATIVQSDFGMKPYSVLFGTLKVADEVQILVHAPLPLA
jgi:polyisoprenoid-binding protein YceI